MVQKTAKMGATYHFLTISDWIGARYHFMTLWPLM